MTTPRATLTNGDRDWSEAGSTALADLSDTLRKHAKRLRGHVEVEAVHDMKAVRSRAYRESLGRALAGMGHVQPEA